MKISLSVTELKNVFKEIQRQPDLGDDAPGNEPARR